MALWLGWLGKWHVWLGCWIMIPHPWICGMVSDESAWLQL
jgi:hypothetical protein